MLNLKKLLTKLVNGSPRTLTLQSASVTIAAGARTYVDIATGLPSNAVISGIELATNKSTLSEDWIRFTISTTGSGTVRIRCHNEYSGSLTGVITVFVSYYLT